MGEGVSTLWGLGIFLFITASRTALGPTQPPIQWVPGAPSLGVKRPGREAEHSSPSSAEVKERVELHLYSPNTPSWRGAQKKHRDNFTLPYLPLLLRLPFYDGQLLRKWQPKFAARHTEASDRQRSTNHRLGERRASQHGAVRNDLSYCQQHQCKIPTHLLYWDKVISSYCII
jgi:hypothetical protein